MSPQSFSLSAGICEHALSTEYAVFSHSLTLLSPFITGSSNSLSHVSPTASRSSPILREDGTFEKVISQNSLPFLSLKHDTKSVSQQNLSLTFFLIRSAVFVSKLTSPLNSFSRSRSISLMPPNWSAVTSRTSSVFLSAASEKTTPKNSLEYVSAKEVCRIHLLENGDGSLSRDITPPFFSVSYISSSAFLVSLKFCSQQKSYLPHPQQTEL